MNNSFSCYSLSLAEIKVPVRFLFPDTAKLFREYCASEQPEQAGLFLSEEDWAWGKQIGFEKNPLAEYSLFTASISEYLLDYKRCVVHAVAFSHEGRGWLITAPSGVGKSTQIKTLQKLYPGEFSVICGDRPVLQLTDDDRVVVHPSPWNGKEDWYGAQAAPLEGIVCLRRGEENSLSILSSRQAAIPVFSAMIHNGSSEEKIHQVAAFETELLKRVPVWMLTNKGVPDSTELLYRELFA